MAKTPSPKVIATKLLLKQLTEIDPLDVTPEALTELASSRVNEAKADKVMEQVEKITKKFVERLEKVMEKFEDTPKGKGKPAKNGKPESTKKAPKAQTEPDDGDDEDDAPPPKKSRDAEIAEKTAVLKKKKKKKKNRD